MVYALDGTDRSLYIDPRECRIGRANEVNTSRLLGTLAIFPFARRLNMTAEAIQVLVARARADAANPSLKAYFPL